VSTYLERVDLPFYRQQIADFLPDEVLDFHTHVGRPEHFVRPAAPPRNWAEYVTPRAWTVDSLYRYYARLFPGKRIVPVIFGSLVGEPLVDPLNDYVATTAAHFGAYSFLLTRPEWSADELEQRLRAGFRGLKPYPTMVRGEPATEIGIFDFLPHHHLALAQEMNLCVLLHLPRPGRLDDPDNLSELHELVRRYPRLKLVVEHLGRSYCLPGAARGLAAMRDLPTVSYGIAACATEEVFELALREVGPRRLVFGSDIPYVAFRCRRLCEGDNYVNIVRGANFTDPHLRVAPPETRDTITFYVYEQIAGVRRAAERAGLSRAGVEDIFRNNALRLLNE